MKCKIMNFAKMLTSLESTISKKTFLSATPLAMRQRLSMYSVVSMWRLTVQLCLCVINFYKQDTSKTVSLQNL